MMTKDRNGVGESGTVAVNDFSTMKVSESHGYKLTSPPYAVSSSLTVSNKVE